MTVSKRPATDAARKRAPPAALAHYETVALLLQGGGALGAYQAGVYEGLDEAGIAPGWLAGISIGAINTALIAGNPPGARVARLREFWEMVCQPPVLPAVPPFAEMAFFKSNDQLREAFAAFQASRALFEGQKGFFVPRFPPSVPFLSGDPGQTSYYDTAPLRATLERLVDFDRLNNGEIRVSVGAVNVRDGNFEYFDTARQTLGAEHFMASGALPPGFPPVKIGRDYYWDGGLVSNTPLSEVLQGEPRRDTLAFQVDLWSAIGEVPRNLVDVTARQKDIQYSSRTRLVTDMLRQSQHFRRVLRAVLDKVPEAARDADEWCRLAEEIACSKRYNVIHLIYRRKEYEGHYEDYQFGLASMREHWQSGLDDIRVTLAHGEWLNPPENASGFITHDIHRGKPR